jgi:hypothetical protein
MVTLNNIKSFPQLSYIPTGSFVGTAGGENVYQPIKGAFIIHTRSAGLNSSTTELFDIPIGTYSSNFAYRYTNAEILIVNASTLANTSTVTNTMARIFCSRNNIGASSNTTSDIYSSGGASVYTDTWNAYLVYNVANSKFILQLAITTPGGGIITNVGLYKGTYKIF